MRTHGGVTSLVEIRYMDKPMINRYISPSCKDAMKILYFNYRLHQFCQPMGSLEPPLEDILFRQIVADLINTLANMPIYQWKGAPNEDRPPSSDIQDPS